MNKNKLIALFLFLSLSIISCIPPGNDASPTATPSLAISLMQKYARSEILTDVSNGVEMSAANFRVENGELMVDICYQSPSPGEWTEMQVTAKLDDVILLQYGGTIFDRIVTLPNGQRRTTTFLGNPPQYEEKDAPADLPDYRCVTMMFRLDSGLTVPSQITLTISSIILSPSEGEGCTKPREKAQSILDSKNTGITIDCVMREFDTAPYIVEKPAEMSQDEAENLVSEAFRDAITVNGPWIFVGKVEQ